MSATRTWEADVARKLGIGGVINFTTTRLGQTIHVPCSRGLDGHGHTVDVKIRPNLDPNGTCKQMIGAGWIVGRRRLICPDCRKKPKEKAALTPPSSTPPTKDRCAKARSVITPEQRSEWGRKGGFAKQANKLRRETDIPDTPNTPAEPSGLARSQRAMMEATADRRSEIVARGNATRKLRREQPMAQDAGALSASDKARAAKRESMDLLTLSFKLAADGKTGQYEGGYSDARIAKETGLSEAKVAEMREEFFAPLGEPDELRAIREDLAQARLGLAAAKTAGEQEIARIERKLEALRARMGWPVA